MDRCKLSELKAGDLVAVGIDGYYFIYKIANMKNGVPHYRTPYSESSFTNPDFVRITAHERLMLLADGKGSRDA